MSNTKNQALLNKFFNKGQKVVGNGRYSIQLGKSKSGPCPFCIANAKRSHNIKTSGAGKGGIKVPPCHPNCQCSLH